MTNAAKKARPSGMLEAFRKKLDSIENMKELDALVEKIDAQHERVVVAKRESGAPKKDPRREDEGEEIPLDIVELDED